MRAINEMNQADFKNIKLIVFDVDGVLVPRGTIIEQKDTRTMFETKRIATEEIQFIKQLYEQGYLINISSGRSLYMLMDMFRSILPFVSLTYENGSATWYKGKIIQHFNSFDMLKDIYTELSTVSHHSIKGWEPKEFIITIHCVNRVEQIEIISNKYPNLYCLWNGEAYDIGMRTEQTKGKGLIQLIKMFDISKENVIAIGDNLNDKELLEEAGIKITADKTRLTGDFYIPFPAETLMRKLLGGLK